MNGDLVIAVIDAVQNNLGIIKDIKVFDNNMYIDGETNPIEAFHMTISFEKKETENDSL